MKRRRRMVRRNPASGGELAGAAIGGVVGATAALVIYNASPAPAAFDAAPDNEEPLWTRSALWTACGTLLGAVFGVFVTDRVL